MTQKRFFGHISGTESPRTKIFALFGSSHMTGPGPSIKNFGVLGEYVELLNQLILKNTQAVWAPSFSFFLSLFLHAQCSQLVLESSAWFSFRVCMVVILGKKLVLFGQFIS